MHLLLTRLQFLVLFMCFIKFIAHLDQLLLKVLDRLFLILVQFLRLLQLSMQVCLDPLGLIEQGLLIVVFHR